MTEGQPNIPAPPGWYPDPAMTDTQRYWDGQRWTDHIAPAGAAARPLKPAQQSQAVIALILAGSVIGLVMAMQSASLLTGTGSLWTGAAIACAAGVATWVMRKSIPTWVRVVAVILAVLACVNVVYVEVQLEEMRQELTDLAP